jgi:hypothetical protein
MTHPRPRVPFMFMSPPSHEQASISCQSHSLRGDFSEFGLKASSKMANNIILSFILVKIGDLARWKYKEKREEEGGALPVLEYGERLLLVLVYRQPGGCHNGRLQYIGMLIWKTLRMPMNVIDSGIHALYYNVYISALTILMMMIFPHSSSMLRGLHQL